MFQTRYALIAFLGLVMGCCLTPAQLAQWLCLAPPDTGQSVADVAPDSISDPNNPALNSPAALEAPITVRLSNPTPRDADCSVTMEISSQEVRFSFRRILAAGDSILIGPERADLVHIEVSFLGQPPAAMDPQTLRSGEDYAPGDIIDFVLVLPQPPQGACCFDDGSCELLTEAACTEAGGDYLGDDTTCEPNPCPQPEGACCFADGTCELLTEDECTAAGGDYQGDDTLCDPNPCPQPEGACCFPDGSCELLTEDECDEAGGDYQGDDTACDPNTCPQPEGACCFPDGSCEVLTEDECTGAQGEYWGDDTVCDPNPCPPPQGACCFDDGSCVLLTPSECAFSEIGVYQGDGTTCEPNPCPQPGDDCDIPITVILPADMPYADPNNTTCDHGNDYEDTCMSPNDAGEDIIYELIVTEARMVEITLDPMGTAETGLALSSMCPPGECIAWNVEGTGQEPNSLGCHTLEPGTYYIMVDFLTPDGCIPEFTLTIADCPG